MHVFVYIHSTCLFLFLFYNVFSAPRFSSYQQQDSQELLRYLLDALRNEEVYVSRVPVCISHWYSIVSMLAIEG